MSKNLLLASVALLGLIALPVFAEDADPVVARVNGEELHRSDVMRELQMAGPQIQQLPPQIVYPQVLQKMITTRLVSDKGYAQGLQNDKEVKSRVHDVEAQIVADAYIHHIVDPKINDAKIKERYDQMVAKFKPEDEVRARHILVKTELEAQDVIKQLKGGTDFAKLAEDKSKDTASAKQGGDLGYFTHDRMIKAFADAAFNMKIGEVSDKPIKTEFGYHIIKVEDKRKSAPPPIAEVREQIGGQLGQEIANDEIKELVSKAKIEKFKIDGSPMTEPDVSTKK